METTAQKKTSLSRKRLFDDSKEHQVSKSLLNTGFKLLKDFTSAFANEMNSDANVPSDTTPPSSPPSTPPLKAHSDMPPTPTPNRSSPYPRSRKRLKMTHQQPEGASKGGDLDDFFLQDSSYSVDVIPPMEIKITPPSADNTPPSSPPRSKPYFSSQPLLPTPQCNINPFSPERPTQNKTPRLGRIPQRPSNHSRYLEDFEELGEIGSGSFSIVYKCRNRIDGMLYAVKQAKRTFQGDGDKEKTLKEVYALAVLSSHPHVVRYYSAWVESLRLYIQTEYCGWGSLGDRRDSGVTFTETELCEALMQVAEGLRHIHSKKLAHLDVKPENIYIQSNTDSNSSSPYCYKIGDLGLVSLADTSSRGEIDEGDSRYLSRDLLEAMASNQPPAEVLMKADIFALACSIYELALGKRLPSRGAEWNDIRDGKVELPPEYSEEFAALLKAMLHPRHAMRPTAAEVLQNPLLRTGQQVEVDELRDKLSTAEVELAAAREKNAQLEQQLMEFRALLPESSHPSQLAQFELLGSSSEDRIADKIIEKIEGKLESVLTGVAQKVVKQANNKRRESE